MPNRNSEGWIRKPEGTYKKGDPHPYINKPKAARPAVYNKVPKRGLYPDNFPRLREGDPVWCCVRGCDLADRIKYPNGKWKSRKEKIGKHLQDFHVCDVLQDMGDGTFEIVGTAESHNMRSRGDGTFFIMGFPHESVPAPAGLIAIAVHDAVAMPMNQILQPFEPLDDDALAVPAPMVEQHIESPLGASSPPMAFPAEQFDNVFQPIDMGMGEPDFNFSLEHDNIVADMNNPDSEILLFDQTAGQVNGFNDIENGIGFRNDDAEFDFFDFQEAAVQDNFGFPLLYDEATIGGAQNDMDIFALNQQAQYPLDDQGSMPDLDRILAGNADVRMIDEELLNWVPPPFPEELIFENPEAAD